MRRSVNPTADTSQSVLEIHNLRNAEPQEEEGSLVRGKMVVLQIEVLANALPST
jgi:hypothetical protein